MYTNFKYEVSVIRQARLFPTFNRLLFPLSLRSWKFDILHIPYASHCMRMTPVCGLVMQFEWLNNISWRILVGNILESFYLKEWKEMWGQR